MSVHTPAKPGIIPTLLQLETLRIYRETGHCAAFNVLDSHVTLHGYLRYSLPVAVEVMLREMNPSETAARLAAATRILRGGA